MTQRAMMQRQGRTWPTWCRRDASEGGEYHSFILLDIDLIAHTNKGKILWIPRTSLDQKLVFPIIQVLERFLIIHVVDKDTAICSAIECHAQGLEAFLARRIPQLPSTSSQHPTQVKHRS